VMLVMYIHNVLLVCISLLLCKYPDQWLH
jgi:hypothetical protein